MKEIIKEYTHIVSVYIFYVFIAATAIDLTILCFSSGAEFRTTGYVINSYAFRFSFPLLVFWYWYATVKIYKKIINRDKKWHESIIRFCIVVLILCPMLCFGVLATCFMFLNSYVDGSYDECMEECVNEDQSNYNECTFSTCDFPI